MEVCSAEDAQFGISHYVSKESETFNPEANSPLHSFQYDNHKKIKKVVQQAEENARKILNLPSTLQETVRSKELEAIKADIRDRNSPIRQYLLDNEIISYESSGDTRVGLIIRGHENMSL